MPASSIGIIDIGHEDIGVSRKNIASRPNISHVTANRTWKSSQGINFRTPPSSRTWRPSQGIVFSDSRPSVDSPWSAEYGNGEARALSTSARRDTSRSPGVPSSNDPNDLPISSSSQKRSVAPLGSIEQQVGNMSIGERQALGKAVSMAVQKARSHSSSVPVRAKQAQSLDLLDLFPDAKMPNEVSKRQNQVLPESQRKSYSRLKARLVEKDKASTEVLVRNGHNYLNSELIPDLNPIRHVQQGYIELQNLIADILRQKHSRNFRYIELVLGDARDRIRFMKREIGRCMILYRGIWYLMKQAEQIRGLQGADRIKHQTILKFNVRLVEPSAFLADSQSQIYRCGYEVIEARTRRGMRISPNLRSIKDLCDITATQLKPLGHYNDLLIMRYLRQNNGEYFAKIWLPIQDVYRTSQELYRKMEYLLIFWDRSRLKGSDGWRRNDGHQSRRMALVRRIVVMLKCLEKFKAALWAYHNMMLYQWASATSDPTLGTITEVDPADKRDRSDEGNRETRKQILDTTDHESLLDRNVSLELSHAEALRQFPMSGLTTHLSMRPTHILSQQYVQPTENPALSGPDDFLSVNSKITSFATPCSDSCSQPQVLNGFAEAANTALRASKAVTVEANKEPWPQHHLSPLGYHIPEKNMADAKSASPGTRASYWQYLLYRGPNGEKIKVHYCRSKATTERIAQLFLNEEIVGFDIEWKPQASATEGVKKNVALIQLASEERVALFHIARYWEDEKSDDLVAPTLKKIMESTKITKVGVSIKADCTRLRKFMGIDSRGLFELSHLYKLVKFSPVNVKMINKTLVSLSRQVEEHLHLPMWKGEVRSSDWSQELNYEQIYYAASDSYAGFQLYHVLEGKRRALDPPPPRPSHADLNLPIRLANGQTVADYDEGAETAEETLTDLPPDPSISLEEMARDFLNVAVEDAPAQSRTQRKPATTQPRSATAPKVAAADEWVLQWRNSLPPGYKARATTASLRAYALWHHQDLEVPDVAALLRDPPLKEATVASYVLEAIRIEKLPHAGRQKLDMVIYHLDKNVQARYQRL